VTQVVVFFLASLLRCHVLVQDMIVQTVCNSGLGLLAVGMIGLFAIHPVLMVAVVVGLLALVGSLLMIASVKHSELRERLASVTATKAPPPPATVPPSAPSLPTHQEPQIPSPQSLPEGPAGQETIIEEEQFQEESSDEEQSRSSSERSDQSFNDSISSSSSGSSSSNTSSDESEEVVIVEVLLAE
jgi:hypothetical protein